MIISCYNVSMYNWSVNVEELKKKPKEYELWRLEQLINYGLNNEKISKKVLLENFGRLSIVDPSRRRFLELILWGKKS